MRNERSQGGKGPELSAGGVFICVVVRWWGWGQVACTRQGPLGRTPEHGRPSGPGFGLIGKGPRGGGSKIVRAQVRVEENCGFRPRYTAMTARHLLSWEGPRPFFFGGGAHRNMVISSNTSGGAPAWVRHHGGRG